MEIATLDFYLEEAQNIDGQLELQREPLSAGGEPWCSVAWLRVKPVGAPVMENRCGNGLVLRLYPTAVSLLVMKNNGYVPEGRGPRVTLPLLLCLLCPSLQWVCWQANRWRGWVASGLCALSVIKEKKRFMAYLLVSCRLMGCQVSMLGFQISWGWQGGWGRGCAGGRGQQSAIVKAAHCRRYRIKTVLRCGTSGVSQIQQTFEYLWYLRNGDAQKAAEVNANIFWTSLWVPSDRVLELLALKTNADELKKSENH